jgi:hypothetical protein
MTHPVQIGPIHNAALRKEISERLGISLNRKPAGMPQHLAMLMQKWREESEQPCFEVTDRPDCSK